MSENLHPAPGPWKKGQSGNPAGRPKGVPNKSTEALRKQFHEIITEYLPTLKEDLRKLEPEARVRLVLRIAEFLIPKPQSFNVVMEYRELEKLLERTPDKYVEAITAKILELRAVETSNQQNTEEGNNNE